MLEKQRGDLRVQVYIHISYVLQALRVRCDPAVEFQCCVATHTGIAVLYDELVRHRMAERAFAGGPGSDVNAFITEVDKRLLEQADKMWKEKGDQFRTDDAPSGKGGYGKSFQSKGGGEGKSTEATRSHISFFQ